MKKVLAVLLVVLFVISLIAVAASARGGGLGGGVDNGYGSSGIYGTPYYAGDPNSAYTAVNQPNYGAMPMIMQAIL